MQRLKQEYTSSLVRDNTSTLSKFPPCWLDYTTNLARNKQSGRSNNHNVYVVVDLFIKPFGTRSSILADPIGRRVTTPSNSSLVFVDLLTFIEFQVAASQAG